MTRYLQMLESCVDTLPLLDETSEPVTVAMLVQDFGWMHMMLVGREDD